MDATTFHEPPIAGTEIDQLLYPGPHPQRSSKSTVDNPLWTKAAVRAALGSYCVAPSERGTAGRRRDMLLYAAIRLA